MAEKEKRVDIGDKKSLKRAAKKGLKTMHKTRQKHPLREEGRIIKYGTRGFKRNFWLSAAATVVMMIALIILFATFAANIVLSDTSDRIIQEKADLVVQLKPGLSDDVIEELKEIISTDKNVKEVEIITAENNYERILKDNQDNADVLEVLDDALKEKFISRTQVLMQVNVYKISEMEGIKNILETNELFVENIDKSNASMVEENQMKLAKIERLSVMLRMGGIILATIFLAVSVMIIYSTIRMAIFSRREEIYMMKLVGAEKRFIRGPFLVEAEISGVIAGILASLVSYFGFMALVPWLDRYEFVTNGVTETLQSNQLAIVVGGIILAGFVVGRVAAWLAVSKYLRKMGQR